MKGFSRTKPLNARLGFAPQGLSRFAGNQGFFGTCRILNLLHLYDVFVFGKCQVLQKKQTYDILTLI